MNASGRNAAREFHTDHATALRRILEAAWRRRYLMAAPLLLLSPIVVAIAFALPQTFVARTLLLLQERPSARPLAGRDSVQDLYKDKQPALEALLKSDYLLRRAVERTKPAASNSNVVQQVEDLRSALSISTIGQEFVELRLKGSQPQGLSDDLQAVTALFLETLVAQELRSAAPALIIAEYKRDVARAEARKRLAEQRLELAIQERSRPVTGTVHAQTSQQPGSATERSLQKEVADAEGDIGDRRRALQEAEATYGKYSAPGTLGLLESPERILVVDPPAEPLFPKYSRLMLAAGGLAALAALGLMLAFVAELTDPLIRDVSEYEALTGAPVVARLPRSTGGTVVPAPDVRRRSRMIFAVLVLLAFLVLMAATAGGNGLQRLINTLVSIGNG